MKVDWFRWNRTLHRDAGYLVCVLTALYAVSGIAVNHVADWNPNYSIRHRTVDVGPFDPANLDAAEAHIVGRLGLDRADVRGRHRPSPDELRVFLPEGSEIRVTGSTGHGTWKEVRPRTGLFEANLLHLNRLKGAWTWIADAFSVLLLYVSIGGLFMLRGKNGLLGRGKYLVAAGLLVPAAFIAWHYWGRS